MKKNFLFSVLCLLLTTFSFNVNAQIGGFGAVATPIFCSTYDVKIDITDVEWNSHGGGSEHHAVYLDFIKPASFTTVNTTAPFTCRINVNLFGTTDIPVKFFYETSLTDRVEAIYDGDGLVGFRVFPHNPGGGGGVATVVGVLGRVGNVQESSRPCVQMIVTNRAGASCNLPNRMYVHCDDDDTRNRIAQTVEQDIKAYPSPAQNNLFVETNDLDIKEVNVTNLYGQTVSHKVSVRYDVDRMQINTSQLESGIYLIVLEVASGTLVKKVMIQKQ